MRLEKQKPGLRDFSHQHGLHGGFEAVEVKKVASSSTVW